MSRSTELRALQLAGAWARYAKPVELVKVTRRRVDQLLRSLVPLYVARGEPIEITGGDVSRFLKAHIKVRLSGPGASKMWREHIGYARRTRKGMQITPNGVKYVEAALGR